MAKDKDRSEKSKERDRWQQQQREKRCGDSGNDPRKKHTYQTAKKKSKDSDGKS